MHRRGVKGIECHSTHLGAFKIKALDRLRIEF